MAAEVRLDLGQWETSLSKAIKLMGQKESLLERAFKIRGIQDIQQHFKSEKSPEGERWAPWKPAYARWRQAYSARRASSRAKRAASTRGRPVGPGLILQLSGYLRKTMLAPVLRSSPGVLKVEAVPGYSGYLDEGTDNMKARPFMGLSSKAKDDMQNIILTAIAKGFD